MTSGISQVNLRERRADPAEQVSGESILISWLHAFRLRNWYLWHLLIVWGAMHVVMSRGLCVSFFSLCLRCYHNHVDAITYGS